MTMRRRSRQGARQKFLKGIWVYLKERWIINRSLRIARRGGADPWVEKMTNWQRHQWSRLGAGRWDHDPKYYANLVRPNRRST